MVMKQLTMPGEARSAEHERTGDPERRKVEEKRQLWLKGRRWGLLLRRCVGPRAGGFCFGYFESCGRWKLAVIEMFGQAGPAG